MTNKHFDYCILGAGLAGLSLAKELSESSTQTKILVVDTNGIGAGASGSPIGLVNPATGRFANKSWKAEESVNAIKANLKDVSEYSSETYYVSNGVIRPAMDSKIALRMKENIHTAAWPKGWCNWMDEEEIKRDFPNLTCKDGGVWIAVGATVAIPVYLKALAKKLVRNGVEIVTHTQYDVQTEKTSTKNKVLESNWNLKLEHNIEYSIKNLVVTAGIKTQEFDFWKDLPIHPIKGQVAVFECENEFPYDSAVSATGYFASIDKKTFVAGSTYEHNFDHENTDEKGLNYVQNRLLRVIPQLENKITLISQWSGIRASTRDRMPIVGSHPTIPNCTVFTALGSKGLLYSSLIAKELVSYFRNEGSISNEISIGRF
ncbi:MAG: FAD-dependent oxidoreductase [Balneola sp.]